MSSKVKRVPEGFHTITPGLVVDGAGKAVEFYKEAFGAEVIGLHTTPDGSRVAHSEIKIGDSRIFVNDEFPEMGARGPKSIGGSPISLNLYVEDADAVFERAVAAGATVVMPMADQFWGDRWGMVSDPFGHVWSVASHIADVSQEEIIKASEAHFSQSGKSQGHGES
ncbi:MAG TPA: VOC family protein [Blastocatellia bacterium]